MKILGKMTKVTPKQGKWPTRNHRSTVISLSVLDIGFRNFRGIFQIFITFFAIISENTEQNLRPNSQNSSKNF